MFLLSQALIHILYNKKLEKKKLCSVSDMYPGYYIESWNICGMEWNMPRSSTTENPKNNSLASRSNNNYI